MHNLTNYHNNAMSETIKTLVFSTKVALDGVPAGFSGRFKMLHIESGRLYVYRVHITKQKYTGTHVPGMGSPQEDIAWWERMFHALVSFIERYNLAYGYLPSDQNVYQDSRFYTGERLFGSKISFVVDETMRRDLADREVVLQDFADRAPAGEGIEE
ncbi:hypothetical protein GCM10007423_26440 [Dyadobacter endophyticus]|uniref:Uncharacterized protein n=2 Tax=Dyadobacter endophyticus TaxID=1749036 RepID=A0ABQ1YQN8_9BACT|nr:hypothetical protein GCM10007423_26440 [Dyadobacter endophyticus]